MKLMTSLLALTWALAVAAETSAGSSDPVRDALVSEALEKSPEYARARSAVDAERQREPQVGALPDPTLTLGIQNDGFEKINIGVKETSWWQVMVTQPVPWPGKRGKLESAQRARTSVLEAQVERIRLSVTAEVERGYVDLLLVREQLALQQKLEALWKEAEAIARTRYEVGEGTQSDHLRAQLERTRLQQRRIALETTERTAVQTLNRLRVHPLDEPIATDRKLADLGAPPDMTAEEAAADAERRSPDLAQSHRAVVVAERRLDAAKRDRYPDFSVTAGIMPRGSLEPMWLATVGVTLPVFYWSKQSKAVDEAVSRRQSEASGEEATRQIVRLRAQERQAVLAALARTNKLFLETVLVQSAAAVRSTLSQYKVGKVTFASVLDVLRGLIEDESYCFESLAQTQRIAIAQREVSLEPPPALGGGGGAGAVPGAGAMGGGGAPKGAAAGGAQEPPPAASGGTTSGM